jgi:mitochondrial fission protein ELM1
MKKIIIKIALVALALLTPVSVVATVFFAIPNQYTKTYVGELEKMFERLKNTKKRKIIVVGGSNVAFGLRSDLVEEQLGMPCINFGLYGTLGTKIMMDLSKVNIAEGDCVILAPEMTSQPMSLYFNPDAALRALNGNMEMLSYIASDNRVEMLNYLPTYIHSNYEVYSNKAALNLSGVYQQSSFNEYCDISYDRPYNIMLDGYDSVTQVDFSVDRISSSFIDYVNEYADYVRSKGADIYYSYSPTDELCVTATEEEIHAFEDYLYENLNMDIISNVEDYIMDKNLFYDTNFHCNNVGAIYRTDQLVTDLKRAFGMNFANTIDLPDIPETFDIKEDDNTDDEEEKDDANVDANCFVYELSGSTYAISSLTNQGKQKSSLTLPYSSDGIHVTRVLRHAFKDAVNLGEIHIPNNITLIQNEAFDGCSNLKSIYIEQKDPTKITVGMAGGLLDGANSSCYVYVPNESLSKYQNDYNWEAYRDRLRGY